MFNTLGRFVAHRRVLVLVFMVLVMAGLSAAGSLLGKPFGQGGFEDPTSGWATAEQLERIQEGTLDVGIVRDPDPGAPFHPRTVLTEPLVACLPSSHPLAGRETIEPADLLDDALIGYPRHLMPGYVDLVHAVFGAHAGRVRHAHRVVHQETALGFIAAGEGVGILPAGVRDQLPAAVRALPLLTPLRSRICAVTSRHPSVSPAAAALVAALADAAVDVAAAP